ncbi:hypothetical protein [Streptomyces sp. GZWMJZ-114]|uniref:hypothetical protein n=1 Tax=Streptomyces sp. GZWMJZ-114 TaxID=2494734 RepID=UPI001011ADD4|nr:hypothetical protein [Streptomyces sp. GZWMJZ-114]
MDTTTDDDEPTPVQLVATCHVEDCPQCGVPITGPYYATPGTTPPLYQAACGGCGTPITDLVPAAE